MTPASDRQYIISLIDDATAAGASLGAACKALGLSARTLRRWKDPADGERQDRRPSAQRPAPANKLSEEEQDQIVATCNAAEFASLPPSQIVPRLADEGKYIGSESTFYRVLCARGQNHRRGRARPATRRKPPASFEAKAPCQVWSWDSVP
jgi:putative transposase